MKSKDTIIGVFTDHAAADSAVRRLAASGINVKNLSVIGKGYHTEEQVAGFYNVGDRMRVWGSRGAIWGGLWGFFLGGLFLTIPVVGHVIVLGYLATAIASALEGAIAVGGLSAIGGALSGVGVPKDSVVRYEAALKADSFLVLAHGSAEDMASARSVMDAAKPVSVEAVASAAVTA